MPTDPILISGNVKDDAGNPISEARVSFVGGPVPLTDISALTDTSGSFVLSAPVAGEYRVEVVSEGFITKCVKISAGNFSRKQIEIQLTGIEV